VNTLTKKSLRAEIMAARIKIESISSLESAASPRARRLTRSAKQKAADRHDCRSSI
jgi:hypothetical protein